MKCRQLVKMLDELAPQAWAEGWDNTGVSCGDLDREVSKIMVALEPSELVIEQAIREKVDVLITHHPMIFKSVSDVTSDSLVGRKILKLVKNDIVAYSMHTNMDVAVMAQEAAKLLGLVDVKRLEENGCIASHNKLNGLEKSEEKVGLGSVGYLKKEVKLIDYLEEIKEKFNIEYLRVVGEDDKLIKKVAILPGSGKSYINKAIKADVDVLITGDIDYHSANDARDMGIGIIDAGHFETEYFFVDFTMTYMENMLKKESENICILKAVEKSPLRFI